MILWAKARWLPGFAAVAALFLAAVGVLGDRTVTLPAVLGGGSSAMALGLFAPLACAAATAYCLETARATTESRSPRSLGAMDAVLLAGLLGGMTGTLLLLDASPLDVPPGVARNVLILSGVSVCVSMWSDAARGVLASTALLLLTTTYSPHNAGASYVRILQPEANDAWATTTAVAAVVAALASVALQRRVRHQ